MRESHLPEDDELVRLAFDEFPEPLLIVDPGFHVAAANRAARQSRLGLAGVGPLCQAPAGDCAVGCDPSLAPCILRRVVLERSLQRDRRRHKGEKNEERVSELTAVPLCATGGGEFLGVVAMIRDVTESERQEHLVGHALNEWQSTADAVPDLILLVTADRRVLRCNRAGRALTGLNYNEILGRDVADVLSGTCDRQALEGQYAEVRWQRPRMVLELTKYPVSLLENHSSEVWVLRDVTALKRLKSVATSLDAMNNMGHILTGCATSLPSRWTLSRPG